MYCGSRRQHVSVLIRLKYRDRTYLKILLTFNFLTFYDTGLGRSTYSGTSI